MSFAAHGNWCGPGWSARQWKDAKDLTEEDKLVPAVDELDQACKEHDIGIAEGDPDAHNKFYEKATKAGYFGLTLAQFVKIGGPPLQNYLRGGEEINNKMKKRYGKRTDDNSRVSVKSRKEPSHKVEDSFLEHPMYKQQKTARTKERWDRREKLHDRNNDDEEETKENDEFPVVNPDDAIHATIDEELNQNLRGDYVTPQRPTPQMQPTLSREDRPLRGFRPQGSLTNLLNQENNETMEEPMEISMSRSGDSGATTTNNGNRETLVKYNARAEILI